MVYESQFLLALSAVGAPPVHVGFIWRNGVHPSFLQRQDYVALIFSGEY